MKMLALSNEDAPSTILENSLSDKKPVLNFDDKEYVIEDMTDEQKKYRQDLRDITKTYSSLDDVKWPTKPE